MQAAHEPVWYMSDYLNWILILVFSVQAIYWILLIVGIQKKKQQPHISSLPPLSIIVCAHDEEHNLKELIPLLLAQDHPEFEVIIVDDRSNDGTWDLLLRETQKHPRLRMVKVTIKPGHIPGKKFALTLGIKAAQHDIILLTDADCRPESTAWTSEMASRFSTETDIVIGISPYNKESGWLNMLIRFEALLTAVFYSSFTKLGIPYMGVGRNLAYRKNIFFEGKGFNTHLSTVGGDDDLFVNQHARPSNTVVVMEKATLMHSIPARSFQSFFTQKIRHLAAGKMYRPSHRLLLAPLMVSQATFIPLLMFCLITSHFQLALALGLFRWALLLFAFHGFFKKTGTTFPLLRIPLADILFSFYYLGVAPAALVSRKIVWKN